MYRECAAQTEQLPHEPVHSSVLPQKQQAIEVKLVDPLNDPEWDRLVLSHPDSNLFHRAAWAKVLCRTYRHKPVCLQFYEGRELVALIPFMEVASSFSGRRGVSVPFSDFCCPLVFKQWTGQPLTKSLFKLGRQRNWVYFELRGGKERFPKSAVSGEKYYGHKLDLSVGSGQLFDRFHGSVRRAIRKAEKNRLTVEITSTRKTMLDFYRLHVRTRSRHGLPPQPLPFFLNIDEEIMKANLGFITLVKNRTTPIAAAVFFYSGQTALFKFGASDERSHGLRGNNLAMWEGIKRLCADGLKTLHFGRTAIGNDGLRRFKLSWATEEVPIEYFRFTLQTQTWEPPRQKPPGFHNQLFCRLPLMLNRLAGSMIYPHLD